jgi:hypothetical protein
MDLTTLCCEAPKNYSEEYDCYYCEPCNTWSESKCDDPICEYCINRPLTPNDQSIKES